MAGALLEAEWDWALENTGFIDVMWGKQIDVFSGSRHESDAAEFETKGMTFRACKPPRNASTLDERIADA